MKVITYVRPDGGVSVVYPDAKAKRPGESDDAFLTRISPRTVPGDATNVSIVEHTTLPSDREFRDAWKKPGGGVSVDLQKAKGIHLRRLLAARAEVAEINEDAELDARAKGDIAESNRRGAKKDEARMLSPRVLADQVAAVDNLNDLRDLWPAEIDDPDVRKKIKRISFK